MGLAPCPAALVLSKPPSHNPRALESYDHNCGCHDRSVRVIVDCICKYLLYLLYLRAYRMWCNIIHHGHPGTFFISDLRRLARPSRLSGRTSTACENSGTSANFRTGFLEVNLFLHGISPIFLGPVWLNHAFSLLRSPPDLFEPGPGKQSAAARVGLFDVSPFLPPYFGCRPQ